MVQTKVAFRTACKVYRGTRVKVLPVVQVVIGKINPFGDLKKGNKYKESLLSLFENGIGTFHGK